MKTTADSTKEGVFITGESFCIFSAQYPPSVGGVERYTSCLAKCLVERGHKVTVVCSGGSSQPELENSDGVRVLRAPALSLAGGRLPSSYPCSQWKKICSLLDEEGVNRVIVQTQLYTLSLMGLRYAQKRNIPRIVITHGSGYVGAQNSVVRLGEKCYENILAIMAKRLCPAFFSVSQASGDFLKSLGTQPLGILYNSIDENEFLEKCRCCDRTLRSSMNVPENALLIAFVGRLIPEKGIVQLEKAVRRLNSEIRAKLAVAGEGALFDYLKAREDAQLSVLGQLTRDEVAALLVNSDIFCLPSDFEGFPSSLLEAALAGCYCIASKNGGAKELLRSSEYGCIIDDNNEESIYIALKAAAADAEKRKCAADKARALVLENYTWDRCCDKLLNLNWESFK